MGGIIEDKIFEILMRSRLTASEVREGLERMGYERKYGTINRHLRKMCDLQQLARDKTARGEYTYWNPCMVSE